ncbi:MAG: FMN-binding glutamate synthase family protein, partial [Acidimicrobiales bacterium]|nr:FMN-binding glutamate synthase family protein [Acidimicrobiales bacterium]
WQIGTGYFGCRTPDGRFDLEQLVARVAEVPQVRAIEIKLSQGAKAGLGGLLPAAKVTPAIAAMRGIPVGVDCHSPEAHTAFHDADSLLDVVEAIAEATGLPVGIKSAVGESGFWVELAELMATTGRGVDFITVDGGEGGTGAAPLAFSDHVALPFLLGFPRVYRAFAAAGLHDDVVFVGSGRLGLPERALVAMALGCDLVNVGRTAMLALGCIQSQRCHTGRCPTGVATQSPWLERGLDPALKSVRVANHVAALRYELERLARATGHRHPGLVEPSDLEILDADAIPQTLAERHGYEAGWGTPSAADRAAIVELVEARPA